MGRLLWTGLPECYVVRHDSGTATYATMAKRKKHLLVVKSNDKECSVANRREELTVPYLVIPCQDLGEYTSATGTAAAFPQISLPPLKWYPMYQLVIVGPSITVRWCWGCVLYCT